MGTEFPRWPVLAVVLDRAGPGSYLVQLRNGDLWRRHVDHLRLGHDMPPTESSEEVTAETDEGFSPLAVTSPAASQFVCGSERTATSNVPQSSGDPTGVMRANKNLNSYDTTNSSESSTNSSELNASETPSSVTTPPERL